MTQSLLFQNVLPFDSVPGCTPGRQEQDVTIRSNGRLYQFKVRDKVTVEDPYLVLVRAEAFAIQQGEPFNATPVARSLRDILIKTNIVT